MPRIRTSPPAFQAKSGLAFSRSAFYPIIHFAASFPSICSEGQAARTTWLEVSVETDDLAKRGRPNRLKATRKSLIDSMALRVLSPQQLFVLLDSPLLQTYNVSLSRSAPRELRAHWFPQRMEEKR